MRASYCVFQSIGRSGCEAENGGVVELHHSVLQVARTFAPFTLVFTMLCRMTVGAQDCEQHCVAAGHGGRVDCRDCRCSAVHLRVPVAPSAPLSIVAPIVTSFAPRSFYNFGYSAVACSRASQVQVGCCGSRLTFRCNHRRGIVTIGFRSLAATFSAEGTGCM